MAIIFISNFFFPLVYLFFYFYPDLQSEITIDKEQNKRKTKLQHKKYPTF